MADMPPEELQYQLDNIDESRAPQMIAADISCTVIILVSLFARIVSRYVTGVSLKSDDYTMIVATFLIMGLFVVGFMFGETCSSSVVSRWPWLTNDHRLCCWLRKASNGPHGLRE